MINYAISDYLILEPIEEKKSGGGGLMIPDHLKSKIRKGEVKVVGPGNNEYKMQAKVGDIVMFNEHKGTTYELDGKKRLAIREADCFGGLREE